jgi:hypothetical protein
MAKKKATLSHEATKRRMHYNKLLFFVPLWLRVNK